MPRDRTREGLSQRELEEFRALQEEMLTLSREYSQARRETWAQELEALEESWSDFSREWQGSLEQLSGLALGMFEEITARGQAAGTSLAQSWKSALGEISGVVEDWGDLVLQILERATGAWQGGGAAPGGGGGWSSWLGAALSFGGWFHRGGIVSAHQGLVVAPEALLADEQLVLVQRGEGILPQESMSRLGEKGFEALRTGQFEVAGRAAAPRMEVNIQVQSLDPAGVAGLDWERLVQRHLLPALQRELGRRW